MALNPIDDDYINSIIKSSGPYNPALNKTQGVKLRELVKLMRDQIQQGGGGQSGPQPVTYAQLMDLVNGNLLVPARQYLITDFASRFSKYTLYQDANTHVSRFEINYSQETRYSGPTEPIVVTAQTTNTIFDRADSTIYPNHLLNYTLNNLTTGVTASDKGTILRRIDLVRNVNINFDFMAMKCFLQINNVALTERLSILIENCYNFYGNFTSWYGDVTACFILGGLKNARFESDMYGTGISIATMINTIVDIKNSLIICPGMILNNSKILSPVNLTKSNGAVWYLSLDLKITSSAPVDVVSDTSFDQFLAKTGGATEKSVYTLNTGAHYLRTIGPDGNYVVTPFVP